MEERCKYYTGQSGLPLEGRLLAAPTKLWFYSDDGREIGIDYERIVHISKIDNELHVELNVPNIRNSSEKLVFESVELYNEIFENWMVFKPGLIRKFDHLLHGFNLKKVISVFAIAFPVAFAVYMFFFFQAYRLIPQSYEEKVGDSFYNNFTQYYGTCEDTRLKKGINNIVARIPKDDRYNYQVTILDVPQINALALPGGKIILFRKLIETSKNPEELASVIAHEIAHVEKRHSMQQMVRTLGAHFLISVLVGGYGETYEMMETATEVANLLLILKYSRGFEQEADDVAFEKLIQAGIDPKHFIRFFERIKKLEEEMLKEAGIEKSKAMDTLDWISTHPPTEKRISKIEENRELLKNKRWKKIQTGYSWSYLKKRCSRKEPPKPNGIFPFKIDLEDE